MKARRDGAGTSVRDQQRVAAMARVQSVEVQRNEATRGNWARKERVSAAWLDSSTAKVDVCCLVGIMAA